MLGLSSHDAAGLLVTAVMTCDATLAKAGVVATAVVESSDVLVAAIIALAVVDA